MSTLTVPKSVGKSTPVKSAVSMASIGPKGSPVNDETYQVLNAHQEILENHTAALIDTFRALTSTVERLTERMIELEKVIESQDQGTTD
jgi:hypothetical protein